MTKYEYDNISRDDFLTKYGYDKYKYRGKAQYYWRWLIENMRMVRPGMVIVLHHYKPWCNNYEMWETYPMYRDEHLAYHTKNMSYETRQKISEMAKVRPDAKNCKNLGTRFLGFKHKEKAKERTDEFKQLCKEFHRGRQWWTNGTEQKRVKECPGDGWYRGRITGMDGWKKANKNKQVSEETRQKISKANKGKSHPVSDKTRKVLSDAHKGKHVSEETRHKLREINLGKKYSEDTLKKKSESMKKAWAKRKGEI
jgi:hypothetical protein